MFENDKKIHEMTDEIGKIKLHRSNMKFVVIKEPKYHFQESTIIQRIREFANVFAVEMSYSNQTQSLIQVQVGQFLCTTEAR